MSMLVYVFRHPKNLDAVAIPAIRVARGDIRAAGELQSARILMLKNVNRLRNVDACLHFIAAKCTITLVGACYKTQTRWHT